MSRHYYIALVVTCLLLSVETAAQTTYWSRFRYDATSPWEPTVYPICAKRLAALQRQLADEGDQGAIYEWVQSNIYYGEPGSGHETHALYCRFEQRRRSDGRVEGAIYYAGEHQHIFEQPWDADTQKNNGRQNCAGNPINVANGNKYQSEADYAQGALVFRRSYNSYGIGSGPFGANWDATYFSRINHGANGPDTAVAARPDGRRYAFQLNGTQWQADADVADRLVEIKDTSGNRTGWNYIVASDDSTETYDLSGRLTHITSRDGLEQTLSYSTSSTPYSIAPSPGLLVGVTSSFGHQLSFRYNTTRRVSRMDDSAGGSYLYLYDLNHNLVSVQYPDSTLRTYVYNEPANVGGTSRANALTGINDEASARFATFRYDSHGRAVATEHSGGADAYTVSYGANGVSSVSDPLSTVRTLDFQIVSGTLKPGSADQPGGADCGMNGASALSYDANGNSSSRTDFNSNVTNYSYDLARNLETSRTEAYGTPRARTITTQWHSTFRLPTQIDEPGKRTTFTHDSDGNVLTRTVLDTSTSESRTWTYTYNSFGQVLTANGPRIDVSDVTTYTYYSCTTGYQCGQVHTITNAAGHVTTYNTYNAHGQPLTITDPNGVVTTLSYDARRRLLSRTVGMEQTTFDYWPTGMLKKATLPDSSFLEYTYDAAHRLTEIEDSEGNRIVYTLDAMGNRTAEQVYDPSSALTQTRTRVFNTLSRLWKEIGAAGTAAVTTTFSYDDGGNQTGINAPLSRNTSQDYDELNRLTEVTDPLSGVTQYSYNSLDQLISVTDPRDLVTSYSYNALGDLNQQTSSDTGVTTNTYDESGNLATSTDARNAVAAYTYDALNRVATTSFSSGSTTDQTLTYTYDAGAYGKGRLTGVSDANHSLSWTYDEQGRVLTATQAVGSISKATSYTYANGLRQSMTTPSGQVITYGHTNGKITSISVNGTVVVSGILYDPFGPVRQWTWADSSLTVRTFDQDGKVALIDSAGLKTYSYDDAFRIAGITDTTNSALSWTYGYDDLDRLTSASKTGTALGYTYDANGNRLTETGSNPSTFTIAANSNRLSSASGAVSRTYGYDNAGNTTNFTGVSFTYNNRGRMSSSTKNGVTTSYTYNALGQLVKKAASVLYCYDDAGHIVGIYDGSGALREEIVWLGDTPIATLRPKSGGGVHVYNIHTDHLNTPRVITDSVGAVVRWRWEGEPFGGGVVSDDPSGVGVFEFNLRFPGQIAMAETGLYYNYYRDYDPSTGRYIQSDPIGLQGGLNTYVYASGRPVSSIDPFGLADYAAGWLECEGGKLVPKVGPLQAIDIRCGVRKCVLEHELQHIRDFAPFERQLCKMFGPGQMVSVRPRTQAQSEFNAYGVSIQCLQGLLRDEGCNQECNRRIQELIADAQQRRDAFRRQLGK